MSMQSDEQESDEPEQTQSNELSADYSDCASDENLDEENLGDSADSCTPELIESTPSATSKRYSLRDRSREVHPPNGLM